MHVSLSVRNYITYISISWMRNDRFNIQANILLRFASHRFRSSRFTSEHFTSSPFLSSRSTGPLSVVQVFALFIWQVYVLLARVCQVQSSPLQSKYFFKGSRHLAPSVLFHFRNFHCISQSGLEASERCYTVFLRTDFFSSSGIWTIFSQSRMRNNCFLCSIGEAIKHAAKARSFMRRNFDDKRWQRIQSPWKCAFCSRARSSASFFRATWKRIEKGLFSLKRSWVL